MPTLPVLICSWVERPGQEGTDDAWFYPLRGYQREGVSVMTDFEILSIVIMILTLVFVAMSYGKNGK